MLQCAAGYGEQVSVIREDQNLSLLGQLPQSPQDTSRPLSVGCNKRIRPVPGTFPALRCGADRSRQTGGRGQLVRGSSLIYVTSILSPSWQTALSTYPVSSSSAASAR